MVSYGYTCLVFVLSISIIPIVISVPLYRKDIYDAISLEDLQERAISDILDNSADRQLTPRDSLLDESMNPNVHPTTVKRNRRTSTWSRNAQDYLLEYIIRRLMAMQGKKMPDGRIYSFRFGSGGK